MAELTKDDPIVKWHAIWKAFSGSIMVALSSSPTVILGWDTMITSGKIVAVIGILIGTIKSLDMFFDQTMSRLAAGKLPVKLEGQNGGDTKHITKTGVTLGVLIFMAFYISLVAAPSGKSHVSNADTNRVVILDTSILRMLKREFQKPSGAVIQPMIRLHFCHPIFENLLPSIIISLRS